MDEICYNDKKPKSFVFISPISNIDGARNIISSTVRNRSSINEIVIASDGHCNIEDIISDAHFIEDYIKEDPPDIIDYCHRSRRYITHNAEHGKNDIMIISDLSNRVKWTDFKGNYKYRCVYKFNLLRGE